MQPAFKFCGTTKMKLSKSSLFWSNVNMSMIAISGQNKKLHKDNVKIYDKHRALAIKNYCLIYNCKKPGYQ